MKWEQAPRCCLGIVTVEKGKQGRVREVPAPGGSISHGIGGAGDVSMLGGITVVALVEGMEAEEVGSRASPGGYCMVT